MTEPRETLFWWLAGAMKFGPGALGEIGADAAGLGLARVLVVSDRQVVEAGVAARAVDALTAAGVGAQLYADVGIEPTDESLVAAHEATRGLRVDGIVAVGGGSVIDTAKAVNLLRTNGGELLDYVNAPVGAGRAPHAPLLPLIAAPTTAGSGSESSAVCVMDLTALHLKSGISHPALRPRLSVIDPLTTLGLPREATISSGLDVLSHTLESLTASRFDARPRSVGGRPTYCGSNPVSDPLCREALRLLGRSFRKTVDDGDDVAARTDMMLAATLTAIGSSTAGVHIPHACSYSVAAQVHDYRPPGFPQGRPFVPHGNAVAATLPATLRYVAPTVPDAQRSALDALVGAGVAGASEVGERLAAGVVDLMRDIGAPRGLAEFGYATHDLPSLVDGSLKQQRLLAGAPRPVDADVLGRILAESLHNW
ncbi:alcohol dehydrogenase class IV [Pseudonocardia hierapolitana]|uniref:hydroxyacid-oxoacid transhydrogenase n=1 Tax=Pseudonocardia hierapolitana TaxID=1128676 RepID=A0A561SJA8_9PSEU|nr:hydroxyacid-oxoacid transhydrogenase [Pseudonocardia hierapolitana]TWF74968.1 alcohol dehydrogenase class IV [Pseudonocardia hierapolitana]